MLMNNMNNARPTAAVILIGNEMLSGRTDDLNLNYIAKQLIDVGIDLCEARVIRDIEGEIIKAVNELRAKYDHIFTTGGIGPTHDDITSESIAKAFGVEQVQDEEITRRLTEHYTGKQKELNASRLRMAMIPEGATLIDNKVSSAPGFKMENVYVMAGFPEIMRSMFASLKPDLTGGPKLLSRSITTNISEGEIADYLFTIQEKYPDIEIGSYPFIKNNRFCVSVVIRGDDEKSLTALEETITEMMQTKGGDILAE